MKFTRSQELQRRIDRVVPGGAHTYAKSADQYPVLSPGFIARGAGCRVWDVDGNEFIEYGMGLKAVTLGHAYPAVVKRVKEALDLGLNFTRPSPLEVDCAEALLEIIDGAEMVKFAKDGSTVTTSAIKLARAYTGRDLVGICADHPFFSYDDWFICTTTMNAGIPNHMRDYAVHFHYNDIASVESMFESEPGRIAAVILEAARTEEPAPGFLQQLQQLCRRYGAVLIFDEVITGFRWHLGGAQQLYGVTPDLSAFGKAVANGFALSALCGRREIMRLGSRERPQDNVFLLSTTHGAELSGVAAALQTMEVFRSEPVIEHLHRQGQRLATGIRDSTRRHGLERHFQLVGRPCCLYYSTRGTDGKPSQAFRTLFLQETIRRGVLAPSFAVSYSHSDDDIDRTVQAVDGALGVYVRALDSCVEHHLVGRPSRKVLG